MTSDEVPAADVGVIGGSGFYDLDQVVDTVEISTPWTRLRSSHARHITDGIDAGETRLQVRRIDGNPAILGHAALRNHTRDAVLWNAEKELVRHLAIIIENRYMTLRIQSPNEVVRDEADASLRERGEQIAGRRRRWRDRHPERHNQAYFAGVTHTAVDQIVMQQQGCLAGRRWTLERRRCHPDNSPSC
jgi:hypothetical protein